MKLVINEAILDQSVIPEYSRAICIEIKYHQFRDVWQSEKISSLSINIFLSKLKLKVGHLLVLSAH
jgi:hypothetical protein